MLVTVTNLTSREINKPAVAEDGEALPGGNHPEEATHRTDPLPYPFHRYVGTLDANGGANDSIQLPMHPSDWRVNGGLANAQMARGLPVRDEWNQLVQGGVVSFAVAAQAGTQDQEEIYTSAV